MTCYCFYVFVAGSGEDNFKCPNCGRSYKSNSSLNRHIRYECGKEPQFRCPDCFYRAKHKAALNCHTISRHNKKLF